MHAIAAVGAGAPLGDVQLGLRVVTQADGLAQPRQVVAQGVDIAYGVLSLLRYGIQGVVRRVGVARDEVHGQLFLLTVGEELLNPHALPLLLVDGLLGVEHRTRVVGALAVVTVVGYEVAGGGTAHAQAGTDALHGLGRGLVEQEIVGLGAVEEAEVQVWLVPHLEVPRRHLVEAVAVYEVLAESFNQVVPLGVTRAVDGHAVAVPHLQLGGVGSDALGEERQLDEGAHAKGEHTVVDLVDVLPAVDGLAAGPLEVDVHVVVEQAVHAQVAEAAGLHGLLQLLHPRGAQPLVDASGTGAHAPEMVQRRGFGLADINGLCPGGESEQ